MSSTDLTLPASFGAPPAALANAASVNDELGAGVASSYGIVGIKGKVWSIRFGGVETKLMREDGDGPRNSIEVVLIKAAPAVSKIYYPDGYTDGSNEAPACWSADGIKPDGSVQKKVHTNCADCPMNAWGSRVTEAGKNGKACADSRRVAVVPLADMENELHGGPMLLRIPAASLKTLKAYGDLLAANQFPYYAAATRISFDPNEAYPKLVLSAIRPLTTAELEKSQQLRADRRTATVLSETQSVGAGLVGEAAAAPEVKASPFEEDQPLSVQAAATGPAQGVTTAKPAPEPEKTTVASQEPVSAPAQTDNPAGAAVETPAEKRARLMRELAEAEEAEAKEKATAQTVPAGAAAPGAFDDMLDNLLG